MADDLNHMSSSMIDRNTGNDIELIASRALDRIVALTIFGTDAPHAIMSEYDLPWFSTDIEAAWKVVEKLDNMGWYVTITRLGHGSALHPTPRYWACSTWPPDQYSSGDTVCVAICRAALRAISTRNTANDLNQRPDFGPPEMMPWEDMPETWRQLWPMAPLKGQPLYSLTTPQLTGRRDWIERTGLYASLLPVIEEILAARMGE